MHLALSIWLCSSTQPHYISCHLWCHQNNIMLQPLVLCTRHGAKFAINVFSVLISTKILELGIIIPILQMTKLRLSLQRSWQASCPLCYPASTAFLSPWILEPSCSFTKSTVDKERLWPREASFMSMRTISMTGLEMVKSSNSKLVPSHCCDSKASNSCTEGNLFVKTQTVSFILSSESWEIFITLLPHYGRRMSGRARVKSKSERGYQRITAYFAVYITGWQTSSFLTLPNAVQ